MKSKRRNILLNTSVLLIALLTYSNFYSQSEDQEKPYNDSLFVNPSYSQNLALKMALNSDIDSVKSEWLKKAGVAYFYGGNLDTAANYYKKAISFSKDLVFIAKCYSNIGVCFVEKQDYDSAINYYNKAVEQLTNINHSFLGTIHTNLSKLYGDLEVYQKGIFHGKEAVKILSQNTETHLPSLGNAYLNLGASYAGQNLQDSSIKYNGLAKNTFKQTNQLSLEIASIRNLIKAFDLKEKQDSVAPLLQQFEQLLNFQPSMYYEMFFHQANGIYLYKTNQITKAKLAYEKALQLAQLNNDVILIKDLQQNLSLVYKKIGDYKKAYEAIINYHALNDSLEHIKTGLKILEVEEKFQNAKKDKEISILNKDIEIAEKNTKLQQLEIEDQNQKITNRNLTIVSIILIGLMILGLIIVLLKRRELRIKTNWLKSENERLKTERKLLQSQMNPHFIFNTLNSIQRFILENDTKSATTYMGRFGKLLRKILDFTRADSVTLADELDVLESYLSFEKLRFNDKFIFAIEDNTSASDDIELPPLIIQPFVENAILHGFKDIEHKGEVTIIADIDEDHLFIIILDNGIGRDQARLNSDFDRKSHGIDITTQRLKTEHSSNDIIYEDLFDSSKKPTGTKVTLKIRLT